VPLPGTVHLFGYLMQSMLMCFLLGVIYSPVCAGDSYKRHIAHHVGAHYFCVILNKTEMS